MNSIEQEEWAFARAVADSDAVLSVYAAPEFDEMGDDGKEWIRALVVEARRTAQAELIAVIEAVRPILLHQLHYMKEPESHPMIQRIDATLSKFRTDGGV